MNIKWLCINKAVLKTIKKWEWNRSNLKASLTYDAEVEYDLGVYALSYYLCILSACDDEWSFIIRT
jgi:hypothetical protein